MPAQQRELVDIVEGVGHEQVLCNFKELMCRRFTLEVAAQNTMSEEMRVIRLINRYRGGILKMLSQTS